MAWSFPDSEYADLPPEQAERCRDLDAAMDLLSRALRDLDAPVQAPYCFTAPPAPPAEDCDWQHGVCQCPACGHVVRLSVRLGGGVVVVDADNRVHRCERTIAAALHRAGVPGLRGVLVRYAQKPVLRDAESPQEPPLVSTNGQANGQWPFRRRASEKE